MAFLKKSRVVRPGRQATQAQVVKDGPGVRTCGLPSLWPGSWQRAACSEGRCQPCPLPEGQPLGCGARTVSPRCVLAKSWPRSGAGRVGRASLQHTVGSHIHAQGRELSNQSLESGFLVFVFISSFQSGLQLAKLFLCIVVSYGSERVVASQMTKGWAPLATM